jgi:hypothetical protein
MIGKVCCIALILISMLLVGCLIVQTVKDISYPEPEMTGWSTEGDGTLYCRDIKVWATKQVRPWTWFGWCAFVIAAMALSIGSLFGVDTTCTER